MLETPHVVVGAAIASHIGNPALALPLALASHFILEKVPHWNPHLNTETEKYGRPTTQSTIIVIADATTALVFGSFMAWGALPDTHHALTILFACLFSVLPDIVEAPHFFLGKRTGIIERWIKWQKSIQVDTTALPGLLTQALTVAAGLWWIFS